MKRIILFLIALIAAQPATAKGSFEGWHLEPGLASAHLVMVVKVTNVGGVTVVQGSKTDTVLREYRFQPVKKLKGLFQRDMLAMTSADLGITEDGSVPPLKEGELRLLILTQSQGQTWGCVAASPGMSRFEERVPLLTGEGDPLVGVAETLIRVAESRSRRERAELLLDKLGTTTGETAVPLLSALKSRADWAARNGKAVPMLKKLLNDQSPAVRRRAVAVLRDILETGIKPADSPAAELAAFLKTETDIGARLQAVESLGLLAETKEIRDTLLAILANASTRYEQLTAIQALADSTNAAAIQAVLEAISKLPLDENPATEKAYFKVAMKLDRARTEAILLTRLKQTLDARLSAETEIEYLGLLVSRKACELFIEAAHDTEGPSPHRYALAIAFGKLKDERAVPILAAWLRDPEHYLRDYAMHALELINTAASAKEVRPLLRREPQLGMKLRMARLLARHGIDDGYALATEHLADHGMTGFASLVLASLKDPRTAKELRTILDSKPGPRWQAAALTGLLAIGDADAKKQMLAILADDRHPLAVDAAEAAGIGGDAEFLAPLAALMKSRNRSVSITAMTAIRRLLMDVKASPHGLFAASEKPPAINMSKENRDVLLAAINELAMDGHIDAESRLMAVGLANLLRGSEYAILLERLADRAEFEGSSLLNTVQESQRKLLGEKVW